MGNKLSISNRLIISAGIIGLASAYIVTNNLSYSYIMFLAIAITGLNVVLLAPKIFITIMLVSTQTVILGALTLPYAIQQKPILGITYLSLNAIFIALSYYVIYRFSSGRLWTNLAVTYIIVDASAMLSLKYNNINFQPLYIMSAYVLVAIILYIKTVKRINKKVMPYISTSKTENMLSKKITKILKDKAPNKKGSGVITRYVLAGNKILFIHEPANVSATKLNTQGLFYNEENYSSVLEKLINDSLKVCKDSKISKNIIMPIVIVHDYKKTNVSQIEVRDSIKPDYTSGAVYVCSAEGLVALISHLKRKATVKGSQNATIKYKILKSEL